MSLTPGTRLGHYEILGPLGAGGMGEVYKARDARIGRDVAVKVLPAGFASDADRQRRFELEVRAAGSLNHPNVMAIHDVGTQDASPFVVSELLEGETLRERMNGGALPPRKALDYAAQIARGLAAAHEKGIVHRDLKPENLFVTTDGHVKILDFGLAKLVSPFDAAEGATMSKGEAGTDPGTILGTVGYMSPEQVKGQPADHRSDLFSFGAILYEMFSGHRAFKGGTKVETMNAILKDDPPDLTQTGSDVSPVVERVVRRCLEKRPEERFHSAHDLGLALEALSGASDRSGKQQIAPTEAPSNAQRNRRRAGLFLAAIALVAIGRGAALLIEKSRAPAPIPTYQRLTFRRGLVRAARFAADGHTILYSAQWDGDPIRVFTVSRESADSGALNMPDADIFSISSTGELALAFGRPSISWSGGATPAATLARVPLAGGEPREVAENVLFADWAPDGKRLAVVRRPEGRGAKQRLEFPIGTVVYESQTGRAILQPRFSKKGDQIAFIDSSGGDSGGSVAVLTLGGQVKALTKQWPAIESLAWRGDEIVFTASPDLRRGENDLYATTLDGQVRLLHRGTGSLRVHDGTADGRLLLTSDTQRLGITGVPEGDPTGRDLSWLDGSLVSDLTPDGKQLLFTETFAGGGPQRSVYLRKTDGSPAVRLGDGLARAISPDGKWALTMPTISAKYLELVPSGAGESKKIDGQGVSYWSARFLKGGDRIIAKAAEEGRRPRLWLQPIAGGKPKPVTPEGVDSWTVSPDGTRVAANLSDPALFIYPIEGGDPQPISGVDPGEQLFQGGWIDGGRSLLLVRIVGAALHITRLDLATGRKERWKELRPAEMAGVAGYSWLLSTADGRSFVYSYYRSLSDLYLVTGVR